MGLIPLLQINYTNPEIIGKVAPLFGDGNTMLIFSAVVFGLGMRTVWRYYEERRKENPDALKGFDIQFFYTAILAFVAVGMPAMSFMPAATATFNAMVPQWGVVFAWGFTAGIVYAGNAGINYGVKLATEGIAVKAVESGKLDKAIEKRMGVLQSGSGQKQSESPNSTTKDPVSP